MPLLAGTAEVVITPPVGTFLEGYGARSSGSVGVHDDLHARAVVVDDGTTQAAIVSCDLIGIDRHTTGAVRALVAEATDIPAEHVMVAATHTHAGPSACTGRTTARCADVTNRLIAGAVEQAWRAKRPAVLKAGRGSVDSCEPEPPRPCIARGRCVARVAVRRALTRGAAGGVDRELRLPLDGALSHEHADQRRLPGLRDRHSAQGRRRIARRCSSTAPAAT